jgi:hypothetical protein
MAQLHFSEQQLIRSGETFHLFQLVKKGQHNVGTCMIIPEEKASSL